MCKTLSLLLPLLRDWSNNNSSVNREAAQENRNNNQIRDNDEDYDQSSLAPEERTLIVVRETKGIGESKKGK